MKKDKGEYELVPVTPLRRLEKEIEKLKREGIGGGPSEETTETLKAIKESVAGLSKSNRSLFDKISSMVNKLDKTNKSLDELINMLKEAGEVVRKEEIVGKEKPGEVNKKLRHLRSRFEDLLDQNRIILDRLARLEERLGLREARPTRR